MSSHCPSSPTSDGSSSSQQRQVVVGKRRRSHDPTSRKRKKRYQKPDGYPSRPLSAYNFFFKEERVKFLQEYKEGTSEYLNMGTVIAARWKKVSKEQRKSYEALSAADKERFQRELDAYHAVIMGRSTHAPTKLNTNKDPSSPSTSPSTVSPVASVHSLNTARQALTANLLTASFASQQQHSVCNPTPATVQFITGALQQQQHHHHRVQQQYHIQQPQPQLQQQKMQMQMQHLLLPPSTQTNDRLADRLVDALLRQFVGKLSPQLHHQQQSAPPDWIDNQSIQLLLDLNQASQFLTTETASLLEQLMRVQDLMAQIVAGK